MTTKNMMDLVTELLAAPTHKWDQMARNAGLDQPSRQKLINWVYKEYPMGAVIRMGTAQELLASRNNTCRIDDPEGIGNFGLYHNDEDIFVVKID